MSENNMKIAFIGVSHWHVPLYFGGIPQGSVVAVSDDRADLARPFAEKLSCPAYTDYRQLLRETKPDFVFAFARHDKMHELAMDLLRAGIPFSIEKPAGLNGDQVQELCDYAAGHNSFCSIPFVWRYSDTVKDLKEKYLDAEILHMSFKFIAGLPSRYLATSDWMLDTRTAGGGCMTNLGVHFIDMALYLTGSTGAEALASVYQYGSEYNIETYATSLLRLSSGASLLLESGYAYPMTETEKRENRWNIVTRKGYFTLGENNLELRKYGEPVDNIALNTDSDPYYAVYARQTLSDCLNGTRPRASLEEMVTVRRILDEMDAKARAAEKQF